MNLTKEQWEIVKPLIPHSSERRDGRGRPRADPRAVLNGILWVLCTGDSWYFLPERFPSYQTCHRYYRQWTRSGVMKAILAALAVDLRDRGGVDITRCIVNGTFVFPREFRPDVSSPGSSSSNSTNAQSTWQFITTLLFYRIYLARAPHLRAVV